MKRFLVAVPVLVGLLSIGAAAQSVATAELHVTVKDPNGRLVTNAKICGSLGAYASRKGWPWTG